MAQVFRSVSHSDCRRPAGSIVATCLVIALHVGLLGCSSKPQYFRGGLSAAEGKGALAVLPLVNLTRYEQAPDIVLNTLLVELLDSKIFTVIDPGLVETVVLEKRLRFADRLPLDVLREVGERLGVKYVLVGTVNQFSVVREGDHDLPTVSISLRIITTANGRIVWAATHTKRGDDAETLFGIGRIKTLEQLASATVREITRTLKP